MTSAAARELADAAAAWAARMDGENWTEADEAELQAWLSADERRTGALLRAQAAWAYIRPPQEMAAADGTEARRPARRWVMGMAGGAIAASLAGALVWTSGGRHFQTGVGEIRRIPLGDGSIAAINTSSELDIDFAETRREVRLVTGEAWFQVAKDARRPFIVSAGPVRVQAVGTAFAVRRRDGGAEISVTEGVVDVWAEAGDRRKARVIAGSRVFVAGDSVIRSDPNAASSVDRNLAWRSGKIDLLGQRLDNAVREFNRYNRRQLVIADEALAAEQLDGVFGTDDPEGFAKAVQMTLGVPVDLSDPATIRIGDRPER